MAVFLARMVMPFSRSRSIESMTAPPLPGAHGKTRLPEHGIDEGGLSVVNVRDDRDVTKVFAKSMGIVLVCGFVRRRTSFPVLDAARLSEGPR